jgi:hypothetical protein
MYRFVVLAALAVGCSDNALPTANNSSGATTAGTNGSTTAGTNGSTNGATTGTGGTTTSSGTTAGSTTAGTTTAGTGGSTGGTTGGPVGSPCKTACDCTSGLGCFMNACVQPPMGQQFFCCDDPSCPSGTFCQGSNGSFGMCGTPMAGTCKTACDCPAGQACFNGGCVTPPMGPLYCCDNGSCPAGGGFCQASDGSFNQCGGGGTSTGGTTGGTMTCDTHMCMSDADCMMIGCTNGCSMRRHVCRN